MRAARRAAQAAQGGTVDPTTELLGTALARGEAAAELYRSETPFAAIMRELDPSHPVRRKYDLEQLQEQA